MATFEAITALDAQKQAGRVLSEKLELFVTLTGNDEDYETLGVVSQDNGLSGAFEYTDIEDGSVIWKTIPIKEGWTLEGKIMQTGNAKLIAHVLGKGQVDTTTTPGVTRIGLSSKPKVPGKYKYMAIGKMDDGRNVKIVFWQGQMKSESFKLSAADMANGTDYKLVGTPDYTKDAEEQLGYIEFEDAA